jgi:GT2 family glycosyltransferase
MVQGACLVIRRDVLDQLDGFDERFFLYFEETDLCKRAADAGWETHYVGSTSVVHAGSQSSADQRPNAREFIRSMYLFHHKHYGLARAAALWLVLAPYHVLKTARMRIETRRRPDDARLERDTQTVSERCAAHFTLLGRR